jgi:ubiquinone biosynthesis protein
VVEGWIRENLGPAQIARDLASTARVLTRLGPRLPGLAEELLLLAEEARTRRKRAAGSAAPDSTPRRWLWAAAGLAAGAGLAWLATRL